MTKLTQIAVIFAALTTSVALVSVDPRGRGAPAKLMNMTRDAADELMKVVDEKAEDVEQDLWPWGPSPTRSPTSSPTLDYSAWACTETAPCGVYYLGPLGGSNSACIALPDEAECQDAYAHIPAPTRQHEYEVKSSMYTPHGCTLSHHVGYPWSNVFWNPSTAGPSEHEASTPVCKLSPPTENPTASPTASPSAFPTGAPTPTPTVAATESPTASPTSSPTSSPISAPVKPPSAAAATLPAAPLVSAVGDPHMQNILGQRFDLAQPGEHTLLEIPRGASARDALLRVTADAKHEGGACSDMYFKTLNVTGLWVSAQQKDGYMYTAGAPQPVVGWRRFGKVEVKVAWGRTLGGVEYLNFMVRHLTRVGQDVGGLLGMDDYTQAAKRDPSCGSDTLVQLYSAPQEASFAMADM